MNILTADIGNTRIKLDIWSDEDHLHHISAANIGVINVDELIEKYNVEGAMFCNVSKDRGNIFSYISNKLHGKASMFNEKYVKLYDITPEYLNQLGHDRVAAYIGAMSLFPGTPLLIIDSGTALTADVVDQEGKFCGGNISLGVKSRLRAIHEFTARLPLVHPEGNVTLFGTNTEKAIRNGAINGAIGEILLDLENAHKQYQAEEIIITGGEAPLLIPFLEERGFAIHHDPFLVARGLNVNFRKHHLN